MRPGLWMLLSANVVAAGCNGAKPDTANPCCEFVSNASRGSQGALVVAFPQGADVGISIVNVYKTDGQTKLQGGIGSQSWRLTPGTYSVEISGVRVPNVPVKAGSDTRVRVGVLRVKAGGDTIADVLDASGRKIDGHLGGLRHRLAGWQLRRADQRANATCPGTGGHDYELLSALYAAQCSYERFREHSIRRGEGFENREMVRPRDRHQAAGKPAFVPRVGVGD